MTDNNTPETADTTPASSQDSAQDPAQDTTTKKESDDPQREVGGRKGPEPTRYGDWEKNGIISDF